MNLYAVREYHVIESVMVSLKRFKFYAQPFHWDMLNVVSTGINISLWCFSKAVYQLCKKFAQLKLSR